MVLLGNATALKGIKVSRSTLGRKVRGWMVCAQAGLVGQMEWNVRRVLGNDTAAISTLRCLKLYLERMGCNFLAHETVQSLAGSSFALVSS